MSLEEKDKQLLKDFQKSWSRHKYWVMSKSQQAYNEIRQLAKGNVWNYDKQMRYEQILREVDCETPTEKTLTVTFQHIWGYFKKQATPEEREEFLELMGNVTENALVLENFLNFLTEKYEEAYLLHIRWLSQ